VGRVDLDSASQVGPRLDQAIAALARDQHGVVDRAQLRALGLSDGAIDRRVATGRLHVVYRGVYAVGHTVLTPRGRWMAAVLAGGPGTVLSHAAAGALWGLRPSAATRIDITVRRSGRATRAGLRIHRPRDLPAAETTTHDRIPVTTPTRTILDLAAVLPRRPLERLLDRADDLQLFALTSFDALLTAHPGHRGAHRLRAILDSHDAGTTLTRSDLEERFLAICRAHGFPDPKVNHDLAGRERDFVFPEQRLVVEIDSWRYHRSRRAFETDRYRDQTLLVAGYRSVRITDTQLEYDPPGVAATLTAVLR
jgi:very-short-patch-repair endonuclease